MQHEFGSWLADLSYVGNHGVHLPIQKEFNAIPAQYLSTYTAGFDADENTRLTATVNNPFYQVIPNTVSLGSSKTIAVSQLLKPYPQFTSVSAYVTSGSSIYHALQAQLIRRFSGGASFTSAFTWSKSLDATRDPNPSQMRPWYGISQNDRTLRFATSGIYLLPWEQRTPVPESWRHCISHHRRLAGTGRLPGAERTAAQLQSVGSPRREPLALSTWLQPR